MRKMISVPLLATLLLGACGSAETAQPSVSTYAILFPSLEVAVTTDTVQVLVFDANMQGADCLSLLSKRKSKQQLPAAPALLFETEPVSICELFSASQSAAPAVGGPGTLSVGYGSRSFLAIAQRNGEDFFLGCRSASIFEGSLPVEITLAAANAAIRVPSTSCATLSEKCGGGC